MVLSEEERKEAELRILGELEEEHGRRLRRLEHKQQRVRSKREQQALREKELVRHEFYTERGYKLYVDSRGRENWLTPEEYEWRTKYRRRRRRSRQFVPSFKGTRLRTVLIYAGLLVFAVVLGVFLVR